MIKTDVNRTSLLNYSQFRTSLILSLLRPLFVGDFYALKKSLLISSKNMSTNLTNQLNFPLSSKEHVTFTWL